MYKKIDITTLLSFTVILLGAILMLFWINKIALSSEIYNGQIFQLNFTYKGFFFKFFMPIVLLFSILNLAKSSKENNNPMLLAIFFILLSILFKLTLFNFNLIGSYSDSLKEIFDDGMFNNYRTYNYLALYISEATENYNYYLSIINIALSSITFGIIYLILAEVGTPLLLRNIVTVFILLYIPLSAIDTFLRVDVLYFFLLTTSIYLSIKCLENKSFKYIFALNIVFILLCFTRGQTIYILPLYVAFFLLSNKKIIASSIFISVIISSLYIHNLNKDSFGIDTQYRDTHLVVKLMQYGYLGSNIKKRYYTQLSDDAKKLIDDIDNVYKKNILPHKREEFNRWKFPFHSLIHPENQNIFQKNLPTKYKGSLVKVKEAINTALNNLNNASPNVEISTFGDALLKQKNLLNNKNDQNLFIFLISIIDQYVYDAKQCTLSDTGNNKKHYIKCAYRALNGISHNHMLSRSDNWFYTKSGYEIALNFDKEKKYYYQHENIDSLKEVLFHYPYLYISQSLLTATSAIGATSYGLLPESVYKNSQLPDWLLLRSGNFYRYILNLWYIFSISAFIIAALFCKNASQKKKHMFISILPLYYGVFLSFATYGEFARVMLPMMPFVIFNFFKTISFISDSTLNIIKNTNPLK